MKNETIQFFQALGFGEGDRIYIRAIAPKPTPIEVLQSRGMTYEKDGEVRASRPCGYLQIKGDRLKFVQLFGRSGKAKTHSDGIKYLTGLNEKGFGLYLTPNKMEGFEKTDFLARGLLFYEFDGLTLEQQRVKLHWVKNQWTDPVAVVQTFKSRHVYLKVEAIADSDKARELQRRFLQWVECDDMSLDDPSQLMRLPFFKHWRWDSEAWELRSVFCELEEYNPGIEPLTIEEIDDFLPPIDVDLWGKKSTGDATPKPIADSNDMRVLAQYLPGWGVSDNDLVFKVQCPLAHTHPGNGPHSLDSLHIFKDGGQFIPHCGCDSKAVYQAAKASADEYSEVIKCSRPKTEKTPPEPPFSVADIEEQLSQTFDDIPLNEIFPDRLALPVRTLTDRLNIPEAVAAFILITASASLVKLMSRIKLPGGTGHKEPPIIWTNLIADSGEGKSPLIAALTSGLKTLHTEAHSRWKADKADYESESEELGEKLKDLKSKARKVKDEEAQKLESQIAECQERLDGLLSPMARRRFYVSSMTTEALVMRQADQPGNGFLILVDELAGFFLSMGKYTQKSDDREAWLSFYNGDGLEQVRATREDVFLEAFSASVLGGMQPCKLKQLSGSLEDQDGLWARFAQIAIPSRRMPEIDFDAPELDLSILDELYRAIDHQPSTDYELNVTALSTWKTWHEWIEDQRLNEGHPAIRVLYPKAKGRAARIALVLHCMEVALGGQNGPISVEILQKAIRLTKWQLDQTKLILDELGLADNPESDRVARFITKFGDAGWIKARTVQRWAGRNRMNADQSRAFMRSIVESGYAESNGEEPTDSKYEINIFTQNRGDRVTKKLNPSQDKPLSLSPPTGDSGVTRGDNLDLESESVTLSPPVTPLSTGRGDKENPVRTGNTENLSPCHPDFREKENRKRKWDPPPSLDDDIEPIKGGAA